MTHEDPRQRITIAEVLQDSYFWDCNKKMKLINVSKKHLDLRDDVANALRLVFDGDTSIINGGLTGNLDPAILADPRLNFKNRATYKPSELLIYMRNKVHELQISFS